MTAVYKFIKTRMLLLPLALMYQGKISDKPAWIASAATIVKITIFLFMDFSLSDIL